MPLSPVAITRFRGLAIAADPTEAGLDQCINGTNFDLRDDGRIRDRAGTRFYAAINDVTTGPIKNFNGNALIVDPDLSVGTTLTDGVTAIAQSLSVHSYDGAANGLNGYIYVCHPARGLIRIDGASFSAALAGTPNCRLLATTPLSDRIVAGMVTGTNFSRLTFSDPGDGATWSGNTLGLNPSDGESVWAFATFDNMLFAFKRTKFFVFTGESINSDGSPLFNYRMVDAGKGAAVPRAACTSPYGVFFVAADGVYVTTGGPPTCVSNAIAPLFSPYDDLGGSTITRINPEQGAFITYHDDRVHLTFNSTTMLVYDPRTQDWMHWTMPYAAGPVCGNLQTSNNDPQMAIGAAGAQVLRYIGGQVNDANGNPVSLYYQSGSSDLGVDDQKRIREAHLRGAGDVTFLIGVDAAGATVARTLTLPNRYRTAARGTRFSWAVQAGPGARLDSLDLRVSGKRAPGTASA